MTEMVKQNSEIPNIAPLTNVFECTNALERILNRSINLPGLGCFYGPSGYGKTMAVAHAANQYRAYVIEVKSIWTRKDFLSKILLEIGIEPARTMSSMVDQICAHLSDHGRALIIDEADHLVNHNTPFIELVRDIYEGSRAPIMLVGEENLPTKLQKWERFYGRFLVWAAAKPPTLKDAALLRQLYCPKVDVADDLMEAIWRNCKSTRLVAVNLDFAQNTALKLGLKAIDLEAWGNREFYRGDAPLRR